MNQQETVEYKLAVPASNTEPAQYTCGVPQHGTIHNADVGWHATTEHGARQWLILYDDIQIEKKEETLWDIVEYLVWKVWDERFFLLMVVIVVLLVWKVFKP